MIAPVARCCQGITVGNNPQSRSQDALCERLGEPGASVVCITQQEAEQFTPPLGTIESHASELACVRIHAARITHIKKLHGQLLENHRAGSEQERPGH
jgi:hypothetical protein